MRLRQRFGPGLLVTAAFIGPGTVATATLAGARFGLSLLWVMLFSLVATIVLQEMAARLGLVTRAGLGEALRHTFTSRVARTIVIILVVGAIGLGNAAFQTGNILGAAMGLGVISGVSMEAWTLAIGVIAATLLWCGTYRVLERALIVLVVVMSLVFMATAVMAKPDPVSIMKGLFTPTLPAGSLTTVIALIGTTVVPYNLFLHAGTVCENWSVDCPLPTALRESRIDTAVAVTLGGLVTLAIVITASTFQQRGVESVAAMARQLEPLLGRFAKTFFALGLTAAGLTSAITAPLAAAYAVSGVMGRPPSRKAWSFRVPWMFVIAAGTISAIALGKSPVATIVFAQAANGIILPLIAAFLLMAVNRNDRLGAYTNGAWTNVLGGFVVLLASGLGVYALIQVAQQFYQII